MEMRLIPVTSRRWTLQATEPLAKVKLDFDADEFRQDFQGMLYLAKELNNAKKKKGLDTGFLAHFGKVNGFMFK